MRRRTRWWLGAYLLLLAASHALRASVARRPEARAPGEAVQSVRIPGAQAGHGIGLFYRRLDPPAAGRERTPLVLLHGSPGSGADLVPLAERLAAERPVILPDLPGFGRSCERVPDHSVQAQAGYVLALLDALAIERADLVGYGLGGGVALSLAEGSSERVRSLGLLNALGVVELELFGDQRLNHLVHGLRRLALCVLLEGLPHFGLLERTRFTHAYARSYFDTDQRSLRGALERYGGPMLILHGREDALVPAAAAREHARIVPQSELELLAGGHRLPLQQPALLAGRIASFLQAVDGGRAVLRAGAEPERLARAGEPFDPRSIPPLAGAPLAIFCACAIVATFVSEDLVCLGVGALVGRGRVDFWPGTLACLVGITLGDVLLFLAGRTLGRRAFRRAPWSWILHEERVAQCSRWFQARGPVVIFISRLMPGVRLPTYFAAGLLRTRFLLFVGWFVVAGAIWTPLVVWLAARLGDQLTRRLELFQQHLLLGVVATLVVGFLLVRCLAPLATRRGRRLLRVRLLRLARWEYWPRWIVYAPIVAHVVCWTLARRGRALFSAANPRWAHGGFAGESQGAILRALGSAGDVVAPAELLSAALAPAERLARVEAFLARHALALPVVVKPDVGERGSGVWVCRERATLERALGVGAEGRAPGRDLLVQAHVAGARFAVFYARHPEQARGRILSIAEQHLPSVTGDGARTLEELIFADERAAPWARLHLAEHAEHLAEVPAAGQRVLLGELGAQGRGATFLDGARHATPELEEAIERLSRALPGFFLGRYDLCAEDARALGAGRFRVLALEGVSSEMKHIYDARYSLLDGWRALRAQWRLAFEIGAANAARGARVSSLAELVRAVAGARAGRRRVAEESHALVPPP